MSRGFGLLTAAYLELAGVAVLWVIDLGTSALMVQNSSHKLQAHETSALAVYVTGGSAALSGWFASLDISQTRDQTDTKRADKVAGADCSETVFIGFSVWDGYKRTCQVSKATVAFGWLVWIVSRTRNSYAGAQELMQAQLLPCTALDGAHGPADLRHRQDTRASTTDTRDAGRHVTGQINSLACSTRRQRCADDGAASTGLMCHSDGGAQ